MEWVDPQNEDEVEEEILPWRTRWAVFGVHSYKWWWVRKYGKLPCGCTINPVTRRRVLTDIDCKIHGRWGGDLEEEDDKAVPLIE